MLVTAEPYLGGGKGGKKRGKKGGEKGGKKQKE